MTFKVNAQKKKAEGRTLIKNNGDSPKKANTLRITYTSPTQIPEWSSSNHKSMFRSRNLILKHTFRHPQRSHHQQENSKAKKYVISSTNRMTIVKRYEISEGNLRRKSQKEIIRTSHNNITVGHKPHNSLQWAMGIRSTLNLPHSLIRLLYHLYITSSPPTPNPQLNPPITIAWVLVTSSHSPHYTYWLTLLHSGNFRDVPLIKISVEGGSRLKHCARQEGRLKEGGRKNPD